MPPTTRRSSGWANNGLDSSAQHPNIEYFLEHLEQFKRKHISQNRDIIKSNAFLQIRIRDLETRIQHLEAERHGDRALICQLQSELNRLSWQKGVTAKRVWMELGKSMGFLDPRAVPSSSASPSSVGPSTLALPASENPSWAMPPTFPGASFQPPPTSQPSRITLDSDALPPGIVRSVARPPALGIDEIAETEAEERLELTIDRAAFDEMDIRDDSPVSSSTFYPPLTTLDTDGAPSPLPSPALEEGMFAQQETVTHSWHRFLADGSSDFAGPPPAVSEPTSAAKARQKKTEAMKGKKATPSRRQSALHATAPSAESEPPSADEADVAHKPALRARRAAADASKKAGMVSTDEDDEMVDVDTALEMPGVETPTMERDPSPVPPAAAPVKDVSMSPPTSRKRKPVSPRSSLHVARPSTPDTTAADAAHTYSDHMEESSDHAEAAEAAEPVYPARISRRSSVRARASVNYTLPKLNTKMRKPDPEDLKPAIGTTIVRTSVTPSSSRSTPAASAKAESPINGDLNDLKRERQQQQQQQQQAATAASSACTTTRKSSAAPKAAATTTTAARRSRTRRADPTEEEADGDDEGGGRSSRQVSELDTSDDDGDTASRRRASAHSSAASSGLKSAISPGRGRGHLHQASEGADEQELGEEALGLGDDEDDRTVTASSTSTRRPEPYTALSGESLSELFHTHRPSLEGDQGDRTEFSRPPSAIDTTEDEREAHDSDADMTPGAAMGSSDGSLSAARRGIRARLSRKGSSGQMSSSSSRKSSVVSVSEGAAPATKPKQPAQPRRPTAASTNGTATTAASAAKARSSSAGVKSSTMTTSSRMTNSTAASRGRSVSANAVLSGDSSLSTASASTTASGGGASAGNGRARKRLSVTTNAGGKLTPREYPPNGVSDGDSASTKRPLSSSAQGQSQTPTTSFLSSQQLTDADLAALAASSSASLAELTSAATAAWPSTPQVGSNGVHRRVPGAGGAGGTGRKVAALSRFSASSASVGAAGGKPGSGTATGTTGSFQRTSVKVPSGRTAVSTVGKKPASASQQAQHAYTSDRAGNENQEPAATMAILADGDSDDF